MRLEPLVLPFRSVCIALLTSPGLKPLMLSRSSLLEFVVSHHWLCHKESNDDEPGHVFNLQKILGVESRGYTLLRDSKVSENAYDIVGILT